VGGFSVSTQCVEKSVDNPLNEWYYILDNQPRDKIGGKNMKMAEITYRAEVKEYEKLQKRLEREQAKLIKAEEKAEKLGVKEWTQEQRNAWLETVEMDGYFIKNKADINKNEAWFNLYSARTAIQDTMRQIERAEARLEKKMEAFEQVKEEQEEIEKVEGKEELMKLEFEQEQKEWLKDGIKLEGRYFGTTPSGKSFVISRNSYGYTRRSLHCYTLKIDGQTIFTSGLFWRCYSVIKNS
jgi:hypothetical protein